MKEMFVISLAPLWCFFVEDDSGIKTPVLVTMFHFLAALALLPFCLIAGIVAMTVRGFRPTTNK